MNPDEQQSENNGEDLTITFRVADLGLPEQAEEEREVAMDELAPNDAMLFVKRGPNTGATYLLDTEITRVGRHPDNEVFLDDVTVSRRHADFVREGTGFVLVDSGSLNGTYLNGDRVDRASLHRDDEVQIGKFKFVFLPGSSES